MSNVAYNRIEDSLQEEENSSCFGLVTIFFLGVCCVLGTSAGMYLVITEDIFREGHIFTMVPNNRLTIDHTPPFLKLPVNRIFIAKINSTNYSQTFKEVTKDSHKILYNFLVDKNGVIFEGLGWHHPCQQSPNCDDTSISIAFIGEFVEDNCPKAGAVQAVINFVKSSQANSKIVKCFMTTVDLNYDKSTNLCLLQVASNVQEITKKYGC